MQKQPTIPELLAATEYGALLIKFMDVIRQAVASHTNSKMYAPGTYPNCDQAAADLTKFLESNPCPLYNELRVTLEAAFVLSNGNWGVGKTLNNNLKTILDNYPLKKFHEVLERQYVRNLTQPPQDVDALQQQIAAMKEAEQRSLIRAAQLEEQIKGLIILAQEKQERIQSLESEKQGNGGQLAEQVMNMTTLMGKIAQNMHKPNSSVINASQRQLDKNDLTGSELKCCDYISLTRLTAIKLLAEFHKKYERLLNDASSSATSGPVYDETRKTIKSCIEARNCIKVLTACDDMLTIEIADKFLGQYLNNPEVSKEFINCIKEMSTLPADHEKPDPEKKLKRLQYVILLFKEGEYLANADISKLLTKAREEAKTTNGHSHSTAPNSNNTQGPK